MRVLVDMNLSPGWVGFLVQHGFEAVHWSSVGDPKALDAPVMEWARQHNCVVFTHDLDFSALLAHTGVGGPSVLQIRTHDVLPAAIGDDIVRVLREHREALEQGAIVGVDKVASRVRILPIRKRPR
jgi:predicted nuclease of predicted toxin-antitoxin system